MATLAVAASRIVARLASGDLKDATVAEINTLLGIPTFVRAYSASGQLNITDNTFTKVVLDGESFDPDGEFDSTTLYRWTATKAGKYTVHAAILWGATGMVADKRHKVVIYKNGVAHSHYEDTVPVAGVFANSISDIVDMAVDDYLELFCWHLAGVNTPDIQAGETVTFMSLARIK